MRTRICLNGDANDIGCEGSTEEEEYCSGNVSEPCYFTSKFIENE